MLNENKILETLDILVLGQKKLFEGQEGILDGQVYLQEQIQDLRGEVQNLTGEVDYIKKKTDQIESQQKEVWSVVQTINKRTSEDNNAFAADLFKLQNRVKKLELSKS